MKFKDLKIGDTFDFVAPTGYNSFYQRCTKISTRKYKYDSGKPAPFDFYVAQVGSVNVEVYHVNEASR